MHDWRDVGKEECRKGGMQDRRDTEQERYSTRSAGQEGFRNGGIQDRRDSGSVSDPDPHGSA